MVQVFQAGLEGLFMGLQTRVRPWQTKKEVRMNDLKKLFVGELADIYDAENQLIKTLPTMADTAHSEELRSAFRLHLDQTKNHARRIEEVFRLVGETPRRKSCKGMEGVIDEGQIMATEYKNNSALDAALICAAQKTEHYEITSYGCLCTWAKELGNNEALALLKENLSEEKQTDELLTQLAESHFNREAKLHDTEKKGETASTITKLATSGP
jgi:ferritin-like metal-binding protein YciE